MSDRFTVRDMASDAIVAQDATRSVDQQLAHPAFEVDKSDIPALLALRDVASDNKRDWGGIIDALDNLIAEVMDEQQVTVDGYGTIKRHPNVSRRAWQSEDLLRLILDSRQIDPETGEAESQVDILKKVFGLKGYQARLGALRDRGIDPDEWCSTERRGWKLEVLR